MKGRELHCAVCVQSLSDTKGCGHGREGTVLHAIDMMFHMVVSLPCLPYQVLGSEGIYIWLPSSY